MEINSAYCVRLRLYTCLFLNEMNIFLTWCEIVPDVYAAGDNYYYCDILPPSGKSEELHVLFTNFFVGLVLFCNTTFPSVHCVLNMVPKLSGLTPN